MSQFAIHAGTRITGKARRMSASYLPFRSIFQRVFVLSNMVSMLIQSRAIIGFR
jgi:hypothetical protein